ncbi:hypothetical protein ACQ4PT_040755 [Festuca glaucescens]
MATDDEYAKGLSAIDNGTIIELNEDIDSKESCRVFSSSFWDEDTDNGNDGVDSGLPMTGACSVSTISDHKKRTLEAIQQRYAAAKAKKVQDEQLKCQKSKDSTPKPKFDVQKKGKNPELTPSRTSTPKGFIFSTILHSSDVIFIHLTGFSHTVAASQLKQVPVISKNLLLPQVEKSTLYTVNFHLRFMKIYPKMTKMGFRFDLYKPMHEMWKEYIRELTRSTLKKLLSEYLLSADLHGALIIVAECKAASYQGVSGIMIRDTTETFGIISEDSRFRVVPKAGSVFVLQADRLKVTLIGDKVSPKEKLKETQRLQRAQSLIR